MVANLSPTMCGIVLAGFGRGNGSEAVNCFCSPNVIGMAL
jgi:hypothetical protein